MRICGFGAEGLRNERMIHETFPNKELQDYWSSRPRYEEGLAASHSSSSGFAGGSGNGHGADKGKEKEEKQESWEEWQKKEEEKEKEKADEPPPPPYTLEEDSIAPSTQSCASQAPAQQLSSSEIPVRQSPAPDSQAQPAIHPSARISSLNAFAVQSNIPNHPATPPAATRPTSSPSPRPATAAPSQYAPPPVSASSRPAHRRESANSTSSNWQSNSPYGGQGASPSVSSLADDFSRQTLNASPAPRVESLGGHAPRPPTGPSSSSSTPEPKVQNSTKPINPFAAPAVAGQPYGLSTHYQQSPYGSGYAPPPSSGAPYGIPGGPGGFAPSMNRHESMSLPASGPPSIPGTWSQAAWPPSEWGQPQYRPQQQATLPYQPYQPKIHQSGKTRLSKQGGYQPSYMAGYGQPTGPPNVPVPAPSPALHNRPAVSGPQGYPAPSMMHSTSSPEPSSSLPYLSGPDTNGNPLQNTSPHPQGTSSPPPLHGPSPPPVPSKSSSGYSTGSDVGGFAFPQAHPSMNTQDYYNAPQGHGPPQPHHQGSGYFGQGGADSSEGYPPYGSPGPTGFPTPNSEGYGTPGGFGK